jgi:hypothetical protein
MAHSCPALISLVHLQHPRQHHWWLAADGFPQRIAALLGAPLRGHDRPAQKLDELLQVFDPLPPLGSAEANPAGVQASYRYLIQLRSDGAALSCWRRYPEGIGWQRRCGPMPLAQFVRQFYGPAVEPCLPRPSLAMLATDPVLGKELQSEPACPINACAQRSAIFRWPSDANQPSCGDVKA